METHFKRLTAKHASCGSNPNTKAIQDKVWAEIRDRVNAVGNRTRTIDQIKQRWTNMV
ncbi:hypothetical protein DPMN_149160 [Dreissena polymorpha]|uniref:Myb/SANT-like DNA-binding domain-containing protein n=1 Tax=Dreissena polymorpha TaxID=45954 RepID=A0A9D4J272_DREPO|nr:hypothetical protein DPMN_149160 [Dreissena polymorpha]